MKSRVVRFAEPPCKTVRMVGWLSDSQEEEASKKDFSHNFFQNIHLFRFILHWCLKLTWSKNSRIPLPVVWMFFFNYRMKFMSTRELFTNSVIYLSFWSDVIRYRWRRLIFIHHVKSGRESNYTPSSFYFILRAMCWPWRFHGLFIFIFCWFPQFPTLIWINGVKRIRRSNFLYCSNF